MIREALVIVSIPRLNGEPGWVAHFTVDGVEHCDITQKHLGMGVTTKARRVGERYVLAEESAA